MKQKIIIIVTLSILALTYWWGYQSGYSKHEAEVNKQLIDIQQAQVQSTSKISQLIKREKELLLKIKEKNDVCKDILNFNLRSCFK